MGIRFFLVLGTLLTSAGVSAADIVLDCKYESADAALRSTDATRLLPRVLTIDDGNRRVSWNDIATNAEITDTQITFSYEGFKYVINRVSGEIRLSNPERLARWQRYRAEMMAAAQKSGRNEKVGAASDQVAKLQAQDFGGTEHIGHCERAKEKKF